MLYVIVVSIRNQLLVSRCKVQYSVNQGVIFIVRLFAGNIFVCKTCDKALQRNIIPCQAVAKKRNVVELPKPFHRIRRLEKLLLCREEFCLKRWQLCPKKNY